MPMGGGLGRHLQPAVAGSFFIQRDGGACTKNDMRYYDDGQRRGSLSRTPTQVGSRHCLVQDTESMLSLRSVQRSVQAAGSDFPH